VHLSVVIPTLNEAASLPEVVGHTRRAAAGPFELIVSDCGSPDGTADVAAALGARVVCGGRSRADALNRGAAVASGEVLLFLHADSRLPDAFDAIVRRALADRRVVGGAFEMQFGSHPGNRGLNRRMLQIVKVVNDARYRATRCFFGDQGIFIRRVAFDAIGGFEPIRLFEDAHLAGAMARRGRTVLLRPAIKTSPRRFLARGIIRTALLDVAMIWGDWAGLVTPERVCAHYNRLNDEGHEKKG